MILNKFIYLFRMRLFTKKKMRVYRPCMYHVSSSANVVISNRLNFNKQWDNGRIWRNKVVGSIFIAKGGTLQVDSFDVYAGGRITVNENARLILGSGYMNHDCVIDCFDSICIGKNVVISERVVIRDSDNHDIYGMEGNGKEDHTITAPINVEDNVWIGMNTIILKGVTIGEGAIIGAGSVVTRSIPAHCLAVGVPAKVIKTGVSWKG